MALLQSDGWTFFLNLAPIINSIVIIVGAFVGLWKLSDTLTTFKEDLHELRKYNYKLDKRLTIVETRCELRHGDEFEEPDESD